MQRLKQYINSPTGMNLVNILFWLAIFFSHDVVQLMAYGCWAIWLVFSIQRTSSKVVKVAHGLFLVVAEEGAVFYGGTLETKGEYLSDISSYSVSFYLDMGSEVHTLMSKRIVDMTGTPIQLPDDLGKFPETE